LFDRVIAVDWSARSTPSPVRPVKDAIYICNQGPGALAHPTYLRTRLAAMDMVHAALDRAIFTGERVFVGFDFGFGYPAGFADRLTGQSKALAVWDWLGGQIVDGPDNANNRFTVAAGINALFDGLGPFWGCPAGVTLPGLPDKGSLRHGHGLADRRAVEQVVKSAQSGFKLFTTGSVGSQSLLGLPYLARLRRRYGADLQVWPLETGWGVPQAQIVLAEIYPSLCKPDRPVPLNAQFPNELYHIPDAAQVRDVCDAVQVWSAQPERAFGRPAGLIDPDRIAAEEGWIFGAALGRTAP
jgi:molybdopterin molybdotransferase